MDLSANTVSLLRDEAYAGLCREAVQERLESLQKERASIEATRPPFGGILTRKETRDAFTQSMRTVCDDETGLRGRLEQIVLLEKWLRPMIRKEVGAYLSAASADFRNFGEMYSLLDAWAAVFAGLPELFKALARELRVVREQATAGQREVGTFAALRDVIVRTEKPYATLAKISADLQALTAAREELAREIRVPALPELRRDEWVSRLALMPLNQLVAETSQMESALRTFLEGGRETALARVDASRTACGLHEEHFVQYYWGQLRIHARIHYVEERDIDDVLEELSGRYVNAPIAQRQHELSRDPFLTER